MLPRSLPQLSGLEFGAALRPSLHLAGDFYNVARLDRERVAIYLGDVMGHGPAAALLGVFAMHALTTKKIEGCRYDILPPSEVLSALSQDLIRADFPGSPFVTMIYAVLDVATRELTYCGGGHPPALLLRPGESPSRLNGRSPILGIFDVPFLEDRITLEPGDRVAIYSDGAESILWGHHGHGVEGLTEALSIRDGRTPQELIDAAMDLAEPGQGPADDLTLVMLEVGE